MSATSISGHRNSVPIRLLQHPQPEADLSVGDAKVSVPTIIDLAVIQLLVESCSILLIRQLVAVIILLGIFFLLLLQSNLALHSWNNVAERLLCYAQIYINWFVIIGERVA